MPKHVFISPHVDDACFSCGGYITHMTSQGEAVTIANIFTTLSDNDDLSQMAKGFLKGWGIVGDPFVIRKGEDDRAAKLMRAKNRFYDLVDAMDRRDADNKCLYTNMKELYSPPKPQDKRLIEVVGETIASICESEKAAKVYVPLGIGNHVDHIVARRAFEMVKSRIKAKICYYEDLPYAIDNFHLDPAIARGKAHRDSCRSGLLPTFVPCDIETKVKAAACYGSQIPGFFGTTDKMEDWFKNHSARLAIKAGIKAGGKKFCERFYQQI